MAHLCIIIHIVCIETARVGSLVACQCQGSGVLRACQWLTDNSLGFSDSTVTLPYLSSKIPLCLVAHRAAILQQ